MVNILCSNVVLDDEIDEDPEQYEDYLWGWHSAVVKAKEYFRGVLWPREPTKKRDKVNYRYVIVGMLVTDTPIDLPEEFLNEAVLDGSVKMAEAIEKMSKRNPECVLGDASDVLVRLDMI